MLRALSTLRGLRGAPAVPPLCRETQSLGQQMLNAPFGINGLMNGQPVVEAPFNIIVLLYWYYNKLILYFINEWIHYFCINIYEYWFYIYIVAKNIIWKNIKKSNCNWKKIIQYAYIIVKYIIWKNIEKSNYSWKKIVYYLYMVNCGTDEITLI